MKFLILAIDHTWQLPQIAGLPNIFDSPQTAERRALLKTTLRRTIEKRRVDCICEESDPRYASVAQKMAFENNPRIPWRNIVMTAQERLEAGIYETSLDRPSHDIEIPQDSGNFQTIHRRMPYDDVRERFFATESISAATAVGAQSVLILVGHMHADALRRILEELKFGIEVSEELIAERTWEE